MHRPRFGGVFVDGGCRARAITEIACPLMLVIVDLPRTGSRIQLSASGPEGQQMNRNRIAGNWKQLKGSARQQWGRLTEDDLEVVAGKREHLAGMIQEAYGITREASRKQLSEWLARQHKTDPIHK